MRGWDKIDANYFLKYKEKPVKLKPYDPRQKEVALMKYDYPEMKKCNEEVLPVCKDGNIIENIPCSCNVPAGPNAAYTQSWLEGYWSKYGKGNFYCCSGIQKTSPCL